MTVNQLSHASDDYPTKEEAQQGTNKDYIDIAQKSQWYLQLDMARQPTTMREARVESDNPASSAAQTHNYALQRSVSYSIKATGAHKGNSLPPVSVDDVYLALARYINARSISMR